MRRRATTRSASSCEASSTRPGVIPCVRPRTPRAGTRTGGRSGSGSERARSGTRTSSGGIFRPACCTSTRAGRRSSCSISRRPRNSSVTGLPVPDGVFRSGPGRGGRRLRLGRHFLERRRERPAAERSGPAPARTANPSDLIPALGLSKQPGPPHAALVRLRQTGAPRVSLPRDGGELTRRRAS